MVADLLDSYKAASSHISVEVIDPTDAAKLDALQTDLDDRYGKGISEYRTSSANTATHPSNCSRCITGQLDQIGHTRP